MGSNYNMKTIKEEFKSKGIFYTPPELGEYLKGLIDIEYDEVYDPTCGHGSLLSVFPNNVKKYGQELNDFAVEEARKSLKNFTGEIGDTLKEDKFKGKQFKVIVANPPFSIKYEVTKELEEDERFKDLPCLAPPSKADYMFIFHILSKLKDDGVAVVLNFPGIAYRGNKEGKLRQHLIENNFIDTVIAVPGKKFVDTAIPTLVLILKKNKATSNIRFIDAENELERTVTLEEIKNENFNLSVSAYVERPVVKEKIDILELESKAHESCMKYLKASLELTAMHCWLNNDPNFEKYREDIMDVVRNAPTPEMVMDKVIKK